MSRNAGLSGVSLLLAAVATFTAPAALQAGPTFTVTSLADDGPGTLRERIESAKPFDHATINFGVSGVINLASPIVIPIVGGNIGLKIDGGNKITLSGGGNVRVIHIPGLMDMSIENLTIADGKADTGGGIRTNGGITLRNVTFRNNTATSNGGAIWSNEQLVFVDSCTFEGNKADAAAGFGGAIFSQIAAELVVVNSTFTNNQAARGGAIVTAQMAWARIYNSTISGNKASLGGGLFLGTANFDTAAFVLKNTIVAGNTGDNCATSVTAVAPNWTDLGGNLSFPDNTCPGDVGDPKLGPLADNDGPTQTMALKGDALNPSAAVDHAVDCLGPSGQPLATDQRGATRPSGFACDSGAYEKWRLVIRFRGPLLLYPLEIIDVYPGIEIPISFSAEGAISRNILAGGYPASQEVSCVTFEPTGRLTPITIGNSNLIFGRFENNYTILWKTDRTWGGQCRKLVLKFEDGIEHTALLHFR